MFDICHWMNPWSIAYSQTNIHRWRRHSKTACMPLKTISNESNWTANCFLSGNFPAFPIFLPNSSVHAAQISWMVMHTNASAQSFHCVTFHSWYANIQFPRIYMDSHIIESCYCEGNWLASLIENRIFSVDVGSFLAWWFMNVERVRVVCVQRCDSYRSGWRWP